ncbi:MAG TPA: DUF2147 domain-containing protein [Xanthobacteraceae bacterium]|jgi:uncharacterized protein (DUF2147 family)|nr:DUF2147 domain-containing protein [Xanthobacteraceae bacterium]
MTSTNRLLLVLACQTVLMGSAWAAEPAGEWVVEDGTARIAIDNCDNHLWGVISWEKGPPGVDSENPDPALKSRPTMGMPILLGMEQKKPNAWEGEIYNSDNGKKYSSTVSLKDPNTLHVQGCVLGFLCGSQDWTRYDPTTAADKSAKPAAKPVSRSTVGKAVAGKPAAKPAPRKRAGAAAAQADLSPVCAAVSAATGATH